MSLRGDREKEAGGNSWMARRVRWGQWVGGQGAVSHWWGGGACNSQAARLCPGHIHCPCWRRPCLLCRHRQSFCSISERPPVFQGEGPPLELVTGQPCEWLQGSLTVNTFLKKEERLFLFSSVTPVKVKTQSIVSNSL